MTRVIKNKVVVPKDYVTIPLVTPHAKLTRTSITKHDIVYNSSDGEVICPFDRVYEREFFYDAQNEHIDVAVGNLHADHLDYDIEINISNSIYRKYRFFRFIIRPNINVTTNKVLSLKLTLTITNPQFQQNVNASVALNGNDPLPLNPPYIYWSDGSGYAFLYDAQTHEIWNDSENGTDTWAALTAEISEDEPSEAAEILPGIGGGVVVKPEPSGVLGGAKIKKAVVPQDYARLIHTVTDAASITSINTVTHDLTTINVSSLPNYDMVGEIECVYPSSGIKSITGLDGRIYYITRIFNLNSELVDKYRLIRLIVQPNINLLVSKGPITLYFRVQYSIDGVTYLINILLAARIAVGNLITTGTNKYAFVFDTKTKEFYNDTANGTGLWSGIYKLIAEVSPL